MRKIRRNYKAPFPQPDVVTKVVPVPTDGWDAISPLAVMDPKRAPILDNWVPRPGWVEIRGGCQSWVQVTVTVSPRNVNTLMVYRYLNNQTLFAACGGSSGSATGKIFDNSGARSSTTEVTGLRSTKFNWINFAPALGVTRLFAVSGNGTDDGVVFDGTAWSTFTSALSLSFSSMSYSSFDIRNLWATKRRLWWVLNSPGTSTPSTVAAFMPTDAIGGPIAGTLDLGALWVKGGYLQAITSLTLDGGNGPNDYTVFLSSQGEVTIYQGEDPTSSTDWVLKGVFNIAIPIGDRCCTVVGADTLVITRAGLLPLAQVLPFDPAADRSAAVTSRIQGAMTTSTQLYGNNFGWQTILHPDQDLLVMNVPIVQATVTGVSVQSYQYVMNTLTGAWCRFTGWNAISFALFQNNLYFGDGNGNVMLAYFGDNDNGTAITAEAQFAFNYFEDPGRIKRMPILQMQVNVDASLVNSATLAIDSNFMESSATSAVTFSSATNDDLHLSTQALGHALAVHLTVTTEVNVLNISDSFGFNPFVDTTAWDAFVYNSIPTIQLNSVVVVLEFGGFM